MPATVFIFGILSILLLLWVERVSERLLIDEVLVDAIMDAQIRTATYHLRLEEALSGVVSSDEKNALSALDQAIKLINLAINGGVAEYGQILQPLEDPELRARAGEIHLLLARLKRIGLERLHGMKKPGVDPLLEPQFESVFKEILSRTKELEDILEKDEARNQVKSRRLFISILIIWILLVTVATASLWRRERQRNTARKELLKANEQLLSQAEELTEHREHLAELVKKRTAELTAANEHVRTEMAERLHACEMLTETEQQIHQLSTKLLIAQEIERKRIAMELHDELGQSLSVTKLRLRVIEKGLRKDQPSLRKDCENLLEYLNGIIENVRRISLDLSPTVLEDLGLTSALRWLVGNLEELPEMRLTTDIAKIDHLLPHDHWIIIYRVVQEALTNIVKHAGAENVAVVVRHDGDRIAFSVADDGHGFDPLQAARQNPSEKGLGLTTMNERVRLLGGDFELWSREGEGTRVIFSIPIEKGRTGHG